MTEVNVLNQVSGKKYALYNGDCIQVTEGFPDNSIHLTVTSPPFEDLYIYSNSEADMGNSADSDEFFEHFMYLIKQLYRITVPGRLCVIHCKDLPAFKGRNGYMGLIDFPGKIIRAFEKFEPNPHEFDADGNVSVVNPLHGQFGWRYHSRCTIWKAPEIEMERTNNHGLLHKSFEANAEVCRQGMADYILAFRKWSPDMEELSEHVKQERQPGDYIGTNAPMRAEYSGGRFSEQKSYSIKVWQKYASPVWMDIDQTDVLNFEQAKDGGDERHICPLQRGVIKRAIDLWSNKGDVVFDPFGGIGSTPVSAIEMGRYGVATELKPSYFRDANKYCVLAEDALGQPNFFDLVDDANS